MYIYMFPRFCFREIRERARNACLSMTCYPFSSPGFAIPRADIQCTDVFIIAFSIIHNVKLVCVSIYTI